METKSSFVPAFTPAPHVRIMYNLGACLDIPSGMWIEGRLGEYLLNGGFGTVQGVTAIGNYFKSLFTDWCTLTAYSRVEQQYSDRTSLSTYDTEDNKHNNRCIDLSQKIISFKDRDLIDEGKWVITSKAMHDGTEWFSILKEWLIEKGKNAKTVPTPFWDAKRTGPMKTIVPTFGSIDSLTELSSKAELNMLEANELGDSGNNTYFLKSGAVKTILLIELPTLATKYGHYTSMTAQKGKEIVMASGPTPPPSNKKLQYLKGGDKMKSVTDKFMFATTNCFDIYDAHPMINQSTKLAEYPRNGEDEQSTDLNILSLRVLRSKSGPSGIVIHVIVSQTDGVLPGLTEFNYVKSMDRYGISGTLQHYSMDLLPDVKLSRTTVRGKLENDAKLNRAMQITSEMCQMKYLTTVNEALQCTPKELYDDLIKKGYDWNVLLNTRGFWLLKNYETEIPFLSTMDLMRMRIGEYHPYWLEDDKKTLKPIKAYNPD